MCQKLANFSPWRANLPNGVSIFHFGMPMCQKACQIFKHSSYEILMEISIPYYYIKHATLYLISYLYIRYICMVHKNCIISHFYTLCHIKGKCAEFLFFGTFLFANLKWKYKKTWFLYVTSNKGFLKFSSAKTTTQNKEYVWILWSFWIRICLNWRSEIVIRSFIVTVFPFLTTMFSNTTVPVVQ